jgi:hypothetical protein
MVLGVFALAIAVSIAMCRFVLKRGQPMLVEVAQEMADGVVDGQPSRQQTGTILVVDAENMSRHQAHALKHRNKLAGQWSHQNISKRITMMPAPPRFPVSEAIQQFKIVGMFLQIATLLVGHLAMRWPRRFKLLKFHCD